MSGQSNKRKKAYYANAARSKRQRFGRVLEAGHRGFLLTCNNREKEAVREAYNLLNEYAEELYGAEEVEAAKEPATDAPSDDPDVSDEGEEDIAAALQKEVSSIKNKARSQRRFQQVDSGAKNCVFIKTTLEQPDDLLHALVSDLHETRKCKSRFIMRILPVAGVCRADSEKIQKLGSEVLSKYFGTGEKKTYCVITKVRNNNSIGKHQILPILRDIIQDLNPMHGFDPDNPDLVINMDVIKSVCCMSVIKDFFKFRKYNLQEVVKEESEREEPSKETSQEKASEKKSSETVAEDLAEEEVVDKSEDIKEPEEQSNQNCDVSKSETEITKESIEQSKEQCDVSKNETDNTDNKISEVVDNGKETTIEQPKSESEHRDSTADCADTQEKSEEKT